MIWVLKEPSHFDFSFEYPQHICAEHGGSVGRGLDWVSKGGWFKVKASPPVESLCCVFEQDTLSAA